MESQMLQLFLIPYIPVRNSKKSFALTFLADPPLRVPSLEYPPDIHLSGTVGHFQLSTKFLNNFIV
jgi:hypothetical protein